MKNVNSWELFSNLINALIETKAITIRDIDDSDDFVVQKISLIEKTAIDLLMHPFISDNLRESCRALLENIYSQRKRLYED